MSDAKLIVEHAYGMYNCQYQKDGYAVISSEEPKYRHLMKEFMDEVLPGYTAMTIRCEGLDKHYTLGLGSNGPLKRIDYNSIDCAPRLSGDVYNALFSITIKPGSSGDTVDGIGLSMIADPVIRAKQLSLFQKRFEKEHGQPMDLPDIPEKYKGKHTDIPQPMQRLHLP